MVKNIAYKSKLNSRDFALIEGELRSKVLSKMAEEIINNKNKILLANQKDVRNANNNLDKSRLSILNISEEDIYLMEESLLRMSHLVDPVGERISYIAKKRMD